MKNSNEQTLKQAIEELLRTYKLQDGIESSQVVQSWERIAGSFIANNTEKVFIRNKKLYIKLVSPALKHELSFARSELIEKLNKTAGKDLVEEIVFL